MNRKQIRLNESQLNEIVKEAVRRVLNEGKVVNNKPVYYTYKRFNYLS